ncbi:MAG: FABP family protein [Actinomycetaceae bacterium]|nr:FABP family protein [Actinomycetaceae bacterium]MDY5273285.1 FABP family protein [Arcanobacterium sp.]
MAMNIPSELAPENYPLAWLIGRWRGGGTLEYENIPAAAYLHELHIDASDDAPYVQISSRIWLAHEPASTVSEEQPGTTLWEQLDKEELWSAAVGYLRVNPTVARQADGSYALEMMLASPTGTSQIWVGVTRGLQLQLVTDAVARSAAGADLSGAAILARDAHSDLLYTYDMEAFGYPLRSYMKGRLTRQVGSGNGVTSK